MVSASPSANVPEPAAAPLWSAPFVADRPLSVRVSVPGSKSLTNRWLVLAALAQGPSRLRAPLHSRDSELMAQALRELGAVVREVPPAQDTGFGPDWEVEPLDPALAAGSRQVDCGLAGTVMRFMPPLAALLDGPTAFDGDPEARVRPMGPVIAGLRGLGLEVRELGDAERLPLIVEGTGQVAGGKLTIDASSSSQFVSALLLAAPRFRDGLVLRHRSERGAGVPSMPHVEMTVEVLRSAGVEVDDSEPAVWRVAPGPIRALDVDVEPDLSNAGPFLAAAAVTGGTVTVDGWPAGTTQGGAHWERILPAFGARVEQADGALTVSGPERLRGADLDLSAAGELAPTVAAIAALAPEESRLRGIAHLRGHETDRLAALVAEITRLGGDAQETEDGLIIRPATLHGGTVRTYRDHRMATAGAILGLRVDGVQVEDIATTAKTLPQFPRLWQQLVDPHGPQG